MHPTVRLKVATMREQDKEQECPPTSFWTDVMVGDVISASNTSPASSSAPSAMRARPRVYRRTASASAASRVTVAAPDTNHAGPDKEASC